MIIALYPGTFDPITRGHLDIVKRAASLFDKLVIGVYDRPYKNLLFTTQERSSLAAKAVVDIPNVEAQSYTILTVEFAKKIGAKVIIRGLRASSDFDTEFEMAMMNKKLAPDVEFLCFMATLRYQFLSSSLLKEVARLNGSIDDLVPEHVAAALHEKFALEREKIRKCVT